MNRVVTIVLLAAAAGFPQAQNKAPQKTAPKTQPLPIQDKWPLGSFKVEGNSNYTTAQILTVAGLKLGDVVGRPEFDAARQRLLATGAFETVGYAFEPDATKKAYAASFKVAEVNPVFPIRFEDLGAPDKDLLRFLQEHDPLFNPAKVPAAKAVMERYSGLIQEFLGKPDKVTGEVVQLEPGQLSIVFHPGRARPVVARVSFEGNKVVQERALQEAIWPVGVGTPWTESNFRVLLDSSVRRVYEALGRVRVSFPKMRTEKVSDVLGLKVIVTVDEGEVYALGTVRIEGETPIDPDSLLRAGDFKKSPVADFDKVSDGVERIRTALTHAGYLNARATSSKSIDDAKKTVDVTVAVDAGPQYKMGKLEVRGLDLTAESEIRRIWTLKEGSGFNPDYPDFFLKRVREDGMFDNLGETKAEPQRNEKDRIVDVTLKFGGVDPAKTIGRRRGIGGGE